MKIKVVLEVAEATAPVFEIECTDVLEGLQKLHEKLNDVAMPRLINQDPADPSFQPRLAISC